MLDKAALISMYKSGTSARSIAKSLGISRNTVKKYIDEFNVLNQQLQQEVDDAKIAMLQESMLRKPRMNVVNRKLLVFQGDVERRFREIIEIDRQRNLTLGDNKQHLTASLIYKTLIKEGYQISETTIRNRYREYKQSHPDVFIRQDYEYGQRAEYDFHQIKVAIAGKVKIYHQATISIPKSNHVFGILYKDEKMESVLDSLIQFFKYCNGVFKEMVFDNMSPIVKRFILRGEKQYTDDILKISAYYGFKIKTCNPRSGWEKGHVENSGKVIRRELFSLKYQFESEEELFDYYQKNLDERNIPFLEEFNKEKQSLLKKPIHDYIIATFGKAKVNSYSLVSIQSNFYSVPDQYVGKEVDYQIVASKIIIHYNNKKICEHIRKDGSREYVIDIYHYLNTFLKKPGALTNSLAMKQAPEALKTIYQENYNMDSIKFVSYLMGDKQGCDIPQLFETIDNSVDDMSLRQLDAISELFRH